jgi:hypothetical protein
VPTTDHLVPSSQAVSNLVVSGRPPHTSGQNLGQLTDPANVAQSSRIQATTSLLTWFPRLGKHHPLNDLRQIASGEVESQRLWTFRTVVFRSSTEKHRNPLQTDRMVGPTTLPTTSDADLAFSRRNGRLDRRSRRVGAARFSSSLSTLEFMGSAARRSAQGASRGGYGASFRIDRVSRSCGTLTYSFRRDV